MNYKKYILFLLIFTVYSTLFAQSSLDNLLSPGRLPYLKHSKLIQVSCFDTTGANKDYISLQDGETAAIAEMEGPGVITRIWITFKSHDSNFLRLILLRMYWDGEENPSVEVPVGDFFGTGFKYKHYFSQFVGMSSGGYFMYFPMPFNKSARIEIENQTGQQIPFFYYHVDYQKLEKPLDPDVAYFHAQWRRELYTDKKENYTVLEAEGQGHFVGLNMSMQGYDGKLGYLEGDEMVYVDGERFPSVYGTGTEDYFSGGWYFNCGEFCAPYHGVIIKDNSLGRIAAYRLHVGDAIPFDKSLRFTIEHGRENTVIADYSSTAYWYQKEPHKKFPEMPGRMMRIPLRVAVPSDALQAEALTSQNSKVKYKIEDMSEHGPDWGGLQQLKVLTKKDDRFTLNMSLPFAGENRYSADVYFTKGPDYGNVEIFNQGKKAGKIYGYYRYVVPGGKITLNNLQAVNGELPLQFIMTGKDKVSSGYMVGIDAFVLKIFREFIPEWYVIGPFPNQKDLQNNRLGLDSVYSPEKEIDFSKTYFGVDDQKVNWQPVKMSKNGNVNLGKNFNPSEYIVSYAVTYIYSPQKQTVPLLFGSDDGIKVFLNDKEIFRKLILRGAAPDQDRVLLKLNKGWNKLLLKIENDYRGTSFFARVLDFDKSLIFSTQKEIPNR